ncbi:FHA domain-containing protein [Acaryochloris sp. IP29b_bin.137]|uniref:FHA domain-containing protein n=1 Tax=Acaryochloris sp. IP29b_bin.137 TaxID=2969217 RepID=UPI00262A65EF|nr:FHA domain-containing protein [Acaryochloris sp. IP29b_bin.137]
MSSGPNPQLFIPANACLSHQELTEGGFWTPSVSMVRFSPYPPQGYYRSLVGTPFWTLGRDQSCSIAFNDVTLSRQHALIFSTPLHEFYFTDLNSLNGSFVNEQRVLHPTGLHHGDRLKVGRLSMEFQLSSALEPFRPNATQKLVLMVQPSATQGKLWQELLIYQGVSVIWEKLTSSEDLSNCLDSYALHESRLPDLLLVEAETLNPNPYQFCRWCQEAYPSLKIVLTCRGRTEVLPSELKWAKAQGATDLLPAFREDNMLARVVDMVAQVNVVLKLLGSQELEQNTVATDFFSLLKDLKDESR